MCSGAQSLGGWNTVCWSGCRWALCNRMVLFKNYVSPRSYHPWRTYRCILYCTRFCSDQIKSHKKFKFVVENILCLLNTVALLVCFLGGFSSKGWYLWGTEEKTVNFSFSVASDSWRVSLWFRSMYIAAILCKYIQAILGSLWSSHHNCTLIMGKVVCIVYLSVLLVFFLGGSVLKVDIFGVVKKQMAT